MATGGFYNPSFVWVFGSLLPLPSNRWFQVTACTLEYKEPLQYL